MKTWPIILGIVIILAVVCGFVFDWGKGRAPVASIVATTSDMTITSPKDGETVTSPFTVTGSAAANWYFEGSFPVKLFDSSGQVIVQAPAQAQGNWMSTGTVPFSVTLTYPKPAFPEHAILELHNDNASGDPAHDKAHFVTLVLQ